MPKRILVIGDSMSLAHVGRAIVVAKRLVEEGAEVVFATGPAHQELARLEGFEAREVFCVPPEYAHAAIRKGSHIFDLVTLKRYVNSDLALIRSVRPELIIGDMRLSLNISAELAGIEYWSILSGYLTRYYAAPQSPPRTFPATRLLGDRISRSIFPALKALILRYYAFNFGRYRRSLGLKPVKDIRDVIASPHRNLIADLPSFIPCENLPHHFRYIGPLIWEPDLPDPEWLSQIRTDMPTVYISMGSTGDATYFQQAVLTMHEAGWQVLTTTREAVPSAPHIYTSPLARGSSLLQHSQLLICHGGSGTIYQAISEGVPVVGIATFHDQEINLERVCAQNWGMALDPLGWKSSDLLAAAAATSGAEYRKSISSAQQEIRNYIQESRKTPLLPEH